jgi:RNA polymerase sigma-70 factor (ECF subfamily)
MPHYRIRRMQATHPGVAPLTSDPTRAADAETADVALAASGDSHAFERLYRRHVTRIHSLARRMVHADEADELTQDVFVRAWEKLASFRGEAAFGTWLYRLAVNVILGRRKVIGIERHRYDSAEGALDAAPAAHHSPESTLDFEAAIARLPDRARQVFLLHDVAGYRHEEIGEMLGIVPGTSKSQLHHARMTLRKHLD